MTENTSQPPQELNFLVSQFLSWEQSSRDTIDFKKAYVDMAGDLVAGLVLSQIIYWYLPGRNGVTKLRISHDGELWIAKRREDWYEEIRISPKQLDRALKILKNKRLVVTGLYHFNEKPTVHVRLNWDGFIPKFQASILPKGENENPDPILPKGKNGKASNFTKGKNPISPKGEILLTENTEHRIQNTSPQTANAVAEVGPKVWMQDLDTFVVHLADEKSKLTECGKQIETLTVWGFVLDPKTKRCPECEATSLKESGKTPNPSSAIPLPPPTRPAGFRQFVSNMSLDCPGCRRVHGDWLVKDGETIAGRTWLCIHCDKVFGQAEMRFGKDGKQNLQESVTLTEVFDSIKADLTAKTHATTLPAKEKKVRPPNLEFDAIALGSFGLAKVEGKTASRIGGILKEVKACTDAAHLPTLAADLTAMYEWRKRAYPTLSAPTQALTICKYLAEWRAANSGVQATGAADDLIHIRTVNIYGVEEDKRIQRSRLGEFPGAKIL